MKSAAEEYYAKENSQSAGTISNNNVANSPSLKDENIQITKKKFPWLKFVFILLATLILLFNFLIRKKYEKK